MMGRFRRILEYLVFLFLVLIVLGVMRIFLCLWVLFWGLLFGGSLSLIIVPCLGTRTRRNLSHPKNND